MDTLEAILYTRRDCHLCHAAREILDRHGVMVTEVDIDEDDSLVRQYGECVPVVVMDGKVRFRGHVNELLLGRLLVRRNG